MISGTYLAEPLFQAFYEEALLAGAHVKTKASISGLSDIFYKYATRKQLTYISEMDMLEIEKIDAMLSIFSDFNTRNLTNADPKKMAISQSARRELMKRFMERVAEGSLRWCGTAFPTQALAQDAEMSLSEYEDFVYSAGKLDHRDPVAEWQKVSKWQQKICNWLGKRKKFRIVGKDTDIAFSAKGRKWINCDGMENFPDGEVFTGPIESSVEGHVHFSYPACLYGREVMDVSLTFKNGKVVEANALKGEEFLRAMLDSEAGARYVGEIAFGTNYDLRRFTRNTLFDEKIGGTFHLAVGASLPESGGKNIAALHWDMVCDLRTQSEAYADGELFHKNGKFLIE